MNKEEFLQELGEIMMLEEQLELSTELETLDAYDSMTHLTLLGIFEDEFGKEIGIKQSSAQITNYYNEESLKGKQVIGICNFPEKNIAGVKSEFLVLGAIEDDGKVVLVHPSQPTKNGLKIA